jgi:hypothetical protein
MILRPGDMGAAEGIRMGLLYGFPKDNHHKAHVFVIDREER